MDLNRSCPTARGCWTSSITPPAPGLLLQAEERGLCPAPTDWGCWWPRPRRRRSSFSDTAIAGWPGGGDHRPDGAGDPESCFSSVCPAAARPPWAAPWPSGWAARWWTPTPWWSRRRACSIPELFAREGEEAFRALEHRSPVPGGPGLGYRHRHRGRHASPGGRTGPPLRENSTVIFLRRPLDQLPLDGRPISQTTPLEELYAKRLPLYEQAADLAVDNDRVDRAAD